MKKLKTRIVAKLTGGAWIKPDEELEVNGNMAFRFLASKGVLKSIYL
ncbi:MAG: hypothetical protein ABI594_10675 [Ginsengibacter sp.]